MVSIIIPTLNEEEIIGEALARLSRMKGECEIIVADGGSVDKTVEIASAFAGTISSPKGRGIQMNEGARAASGNTLLFLHADTIIPEDAISEICESLQDCNIVGGTFRRCYDNRNLLLRPAGFYTYTNFHLFGIIAGDQGIFVRKNVFDEIGGFPDIPLMEEVEFTRNLKKRGRIIFLNSVAIVSARRFVEKGVVKTYLTMLLCMILYRLGMSADRIKKLYDDVR